MKKQSNCPLLFSKPRIRSTSFSAISANQATIRSTRDDEIHTVESGYPVNFRGILKNSKWKLNKNDTWSFLLEKIFRTNLKKCEKYSCLPIILLNFEQIHKNAKLVHLKMHFSLCSRNLANYLYCKLLFKLSGWNWGPKWSKF